MKKIVQTTLAITLVVALSGGLFASAKSHDRSGREAVRLNDHQAIKVSGRVISGEEGIGGGDPLPG